MKVKQILAHCLFLYGLQAKNNAYIFKWLGKNQKKSNIYGVLQ